jgi:hypothetical protein
MDGTYMRQLNLLINEFYRNFELLLDNDEDFVFASYSENGDYKLMGSRFKSAVKKGFIDFSEIRKITNIAKLKKQHDKFLNKEVKEKQESIKLTIGDCWGILLEIGSHPIGTMRKKFTCSSETLEEMFIILKRMQDILFSEADLPIDYYEYQFFKSFSLIEKIGIEYGVELTQNTMKPILKNSSIKEFYNDFVRDQFFNAWTKTRNINENKLMYFEFQSQDHVKILWQEFIPSNVFNSSIYKLVRNQRNEQTHNFNLSTKLSDEDFAITKESLFSYTVISCMITMYLGIYIELTEYEKTLS